MKGLTRELLIKTGLRLLDEVGLDGLTVRRLAAELGVRSPALYWHIKTKQELLDGMASAIIVSAGMGPPRDAETWQEWLTRRARSYRRALLAHRDGARVVTAGRRTAGAVASFEQELAAMVKMGFSPLLAFRTIMAVANYINGTVLQEQANGRAEAERETETESGARPDRISLDALPTLGAAIRQHGSSPGDAAFEHGLATFIKGAEAMLAEGAGRPSGT